MPDIDKLINAIDAAEAASYGSDDDGELESDRARAIDYYLGRNTAPAPEGRSQVVDRSVYETIQWIVPSLCRIFANGDDVVELPPMGPDDEESAKQEGQYLNYILLQKNPWFETFRTAALDALMTKAGYLYVYRDKRRVVELERYERQTPESLSLLLQDKNIQVVESREYPDPDAEPQMTVDPMTGQPVQVPPPMLYDVALRRVKEENAFCVRALPPERCKVSEMTPSWHLRECPYFEYYDFCTISDLRAEGYNIPDDIAEDGDTETEEDISRSIFGDENRLNTDVVDPAMRRVRKRMIWIRHDYDEDGIAELQYVLRVGSQILSREEVNRIPVGVLCPDPLPHRHVGLSVADSVMDVQDIKTAILRQGLDNLYLNNNSRTYVNPDRVNLDDLLVSRPGGVVRGNGVYGQDIAPIQVPFVFPQAMQGLEYMDQVRENRTGTNRYFTGIDQNALNKTATGIQQLSSMAAQRVEQIARTFSSGIEDVCAILHELVLKSGHQREVVRLRGKWVAVDPAAWRNRYDFRISVGYAAGNKDSLMARLTMIANFQKEAALGGSPIVQPQNLYETAVELTKAADFSAPERFWTDPSTVPPPQPPQPDPTVVTAESIKAQTDKEVANLKAEVDKYKAYLDSQTKLTIEQLKAQQVREVETFRAQHGATMEDAKFQRTLSLESEKERAKQAPALELSQQVQEMAQNLESAMDALRDALQTVMTARKAIRRGKDGKAEGVDLIGPDGSVIAQQQVVRGPDGRPQAVVPVQS